MSGSTPTELERAEALAEQVLQRDVARRRMLVIVNPYATTVSDRLKNLVVYALQSRYDVDAVDTQAKAHATELTREAADEGYEVVVAFGGDGTVNEAANGLVGSDVPLTCLPGGSTNVFCRSLGIPNDVVDATEHLLQLADHFQPRRVDLGRVNGRHFTFSAGIGLDASVVEQVDAHPRLKARYTRWYYTYVAVTQFTRKYLVHPPRVRVEVGGRTVDAVTVIVQNADPYTYFGPRPIRICEGAGFDSGKLALAVLDRASAADMPTLIPRLLSGRAKTAQRHCHINGLGEIDYAHARALEGTFPLQVDGDFIGDVDEASFGIVPHALSVVA